jgi:DNA-binding transcriptional MerR regulator
MAPENLTLRGALTNKPAAEELGVSPYTLDKWRHLGIGPRYYKIGNRVFYRREDLRDFLKTRGCEPSPTAA